MTSKLRGHSAAITSVAWNPRYKVIATCSDDKLVILWKRLEGETSSWRAEPLRGHSKAVTCVSWSSDGCSLVSSSYDNSLIVWSLPARVAIVSLRGDRGYMISVVWSPAMDRVSYCCKDRVIYTWGPFHAMRQRRLAFAMLGHPRLGQHSAWASLGTKDDLLQSIAELSTEQLVEHVGCTSS